MNNVLRVLVGGEPDLDGAFCVLLLCFVFLYCLSHLPLGRTTAIQPPLSTKYERRG